MAPAILRSWIPQAAIAGALLFGLAAGSRLVTATYGDGGPVPPPVLASEAPEADRARVRIVGDRIPVVRLSGKPYEMGRQHGAILKNQIRFLHEQYVDGLVVPTVGRENLVAWAKEVEPHIPEKYRQEMKGLAEGAGLSYLDVLISNTMTDRLQSMFCSTVVASGKATVDGEIVFGRNLDFMGRNILHRMTVVIVYEPEGETPLAAVTWPGLIGVLSGMNARGVCGATMMIHRGKALRAGMPYMIMYRAALAAARKTSDVGDAIARAPRTCPNNFMVVDATGANELIEFDQDLVARRTPEQGTLCCTNHFLTDELKKVGFPVGLQRYETLREFVRREHGRIDVARVRKALADVAKPWLLNVQSMVFLPARRTIHLSVGGKLPAAEQPFLEVPASLLFGDAPAR